MGESKNWWQCSECGYMLQAATPPEMCPGCKQKCAFTNVTCYTPECGGEQNPDPQLTRPVIGEWK